MDGARVFVPDQVIGEERVDSIAVGLQVTRESIAKAPQFRRILDGHEVVDEGEPSIPVGGVAEVVHRRLGQCTKIRDALHVGAKPKWPPTVHLSVESLPSPPADAGQEVDDGVNPKAVEWRVPAGRLAGALAIGTQGPTLQLSQTRIVGPGEPIQRSKEAEARLQTTRTNDREPDPKAQHTHRSGPDASSGTRTFTYTSAPSTWE